LGSFPAVDPLASNSRALTPEIVGQEHYDVARGVQKVLQRYKDLQDIIAILGMDELSPDDKLTVFARSKDSALPQPAVHRRRSLHRSPRQTGSQWPTQLRVSKKSSKASMTKWRRQLLHEGQDRRNQRIVWPRL
jgi:hypothetical protein